MWSALPAVWRCAVQEAAITKIFQSISAGNPSDYIPLAKLAPSAGKFVKELQAATDVRDGYIQQWIDEHKSTLDKSNPRDFVDQMLIDQMEGNSELTDEDILVIIWDCMAGGIDTSAGSFEWLVYILTVYPDVQRKIHEELDEHVGPDRLPTYEDRKKLKYFNAVICELFRFKHFAPFGIPHSTTEDITICGFDIPKDTQLMFNLYALHHDKKYWREPGTFRPERFLEEEANLDRAFLDADLVRTKKDLEYYKFLPFGFGKRRCVGFGLGRVIMYLKAVTHLHCFEWSSADGAPCDIETEYFGVTLVPESQDVRATPRPAARLAKASAFATVR